MKRFLTVGFFLLATGLAHAEPSLTLVATVPLGGQERWDYVIADPTSHRVYAAHGPEVTVVDGVAGTLVLRIGGEGSALGGTHGIALIPARGIGYVGNGDQVTAFSLATGALGASTPTDAGADATAYDPASDRLFVMNGKGKSITAVNRATNTVLATLPAGGKPEFAAVDGRGHLFANGEDARELLRIDTLRLKITARWSIASCEEPHGLAMDAKTGRLFIGCVNHQMLVVNSRSGGIVATLPIGQGSDAIAFDSRRRIVYSSNGEGTLSRYREVTPNHYKPLPPVPTAVGARTMAVDSSNGRVFLVTAEEDPTQPPNPRRHFLAGTTKMLIFAPE